MDVPETFQVIVCFVDFETRKEAEAIRRYLQHSLLTKEHFISGQIKGRKVYSQ